MGGETRVAGAGLLLNAEGGVEGRPCAKPSSPPAPSIIANNRRGATALSWHVSMQAQAFALACAPALRSAGAAPYVALKLPSAPVEPRLTKPASPTRSGRRASTTPACNCGLHTRRRMRAGPVCHCGDPLAWPARATMSPPPPPFALPVHLPSLLNIGIAPPAQAKLSDNVGVINAAYWVNKSFHLLKYHPN